MAITYLSAIFSCRPIPASDQPKSISGRVQEIANSVFRSIRFNCLIFYRGYFLGIKLNAEQKEHLRPGNREGFDNNVLENKNPILEAVDQDMSDGCVIRWLKLDGFNVRDVDKEKYDVKELFDRALKNGHAEAITEFLAVPGINVNEHGERGLSALHLAVSSGRVEAVRALLAAPEIDVNIVSTIGCTALHWAVYDEIIHVDVIAALLEAGINVNAQESIGGNTALHLAVEKGHAGIVGVLLAASGINVTITDEKIKTPYEYAADKNFSAEILKKLQG